jgi:hypothetical protein
VQRAMRWHLIYAVALATVGCSDKLGPVHGPDVAGTWSGSAIGATLSVTLGSSSCQIEGFNSVCGGSVNGGAFRDDATGSHGTFTNGAGSYAVSPPSDTSSFSSPLTGWTISIASSDSANPPPIIVMTFNGTFSATTVAGYAKFMNDTATDSVAITLIKR